MHTEKLQKIVDVEFKFRDSFRFNAICSKKIQLHHVVEAYNRNLIRFSFMLKNIQTRFLQDS